MALRFGPEQLAGRMLFPGMGHLGGAQELGFTDLSSP